jgi:purine nucleosidase
MTDNAAGRRPVVLTTDCGTEMDDQWAIAHLALCPEIDLRGIVSNHAPNVAPPAATTIAAAVNEVLDTLNLDTRPPVITGSDGPLRDGKTPNRNAGVDFILEQADGRTPEDRLTVLSIGTATDIASALLIDPDLANRIEVVAMGFDGWPGGNDVWNIKNDIPAWQHLMASATPITVGDSAVCLKRLQLNAVKARDILFNTGDPGRYLVDLLVNWVLAQGNLAQMVTGHPSSWPVWDEVVVAHLLGMTTSTTYRRPTLNDDMSFSHDVTASPQADAPQITWIVDLDADRLWGDLRRRLRLLLPTN